jgi:hypothetical protein
VTLIHQAVDASIINDARPEGITRLGSPLFTKMKGDPLLSASPSSTDFNYIVARAIAAA